MHALIILYRVHVNSSIVCVIISNYAFYYIVNKSYRVLEIVQWWIISRQSSSIQSHFLQFCVVLLKLSLFLCSRKAIGEETHIFIYQHPEPDAQYVYLHYYWLFSQCHFCIKFMNGIYTFTSILLYKIADSVFFFLWFNTTKLGKKWLSF